jgi:HD-like signal output (HDOD) protein
VKIHPKEEKLMWIFFVGILLIIGILLFVLFYQRSEQRRRPGSKDGMRKRPGQSKKNGLREGVEVVSKGLAQQVIFGDTGMVIPELEKPDQSEELKKRIQDGIETIFSVKPEIVPDKKAILRLEEITPEVREKVLRHISHLKPFKGVYQIQKSLDDPNTGMAQLSKLIVTDPVLSGKILKVANSSYFGLEQRVNSIGHALVIIGLLNLKTILYQEGLLKLLNVKEFVKDYTIESLWEHATLTSICASYLQNLFSGLDKGTLFTMGLLHDVGKFVMTGLDPVRPAAEGFAKIALAEFSIRDEEELYGINHTVIGRLAFEEWGFSDLMVKTVEMHHAPSWVERETLALDPDPLKYLLVLFLSDQMAKLFADEEKNLFPVLPLAPSYHALVQRKKLLSLLLDTTLFSEIRKAKALLKT